MPLFSFSLSFLCIALCLPISILWGTMMVLSLIVDGFHICIFHSLSFILFVKLPRYPEDENKDIMQLAYLSGVHLCPIPNGLYRPSFAIERHCIVQLGLASSQSVLLLQEQAQPTCLHQDLFQHGGLFFFFCLLLLSNYIISHLQRVSCTSSLETWYRQL